MKTYQRKLTGVIPIAAIALCLAPIPATYAQNAQSPDRRPPDTPPPVDSSANQPPISPRATDLPPPTGPLNPTAPDQPGVTRPSQEPSPASTLPVGDRTADRQQQQPSAQSTTATSADAIQVASSNAAANGVRQLAGQPVLTADGQNLGTLKDFIVDASSGKVAYGVVSSGGFLGAGDTLRAIPCDALQPAPGAEGFTVQLQPEQWSQVSAINEEDFNAGRIDISADQQRQISQVFGSTETNRAATPANADTRATRDTAATSGIASTSGGGLQFQRVSAIRGKNIHSGPQKVGNIEEVVI
ncbi:MAG: PRC-barrel domain-containing protein, partial [Opitutaceae bacterium]